MADKIRRIPSGISGFDELIEGGFLDGDNVVITGVPGTGKTIFLIQIADACLKSGMKVMYVPIEASAERLRMQAWQIDCWKEIEPLVLPASELKYDMAPKKPSEVAELVKLLDEKANKYKADIVIVDSLSALALADDGPQQRAAIQMLFNASSKSKRTTFYSSEKVVGQQGYTRDTISEFLADAVIELIFETLGAQGTRSVIIRKMRLTKHGEGTNPIEIVKGKGIVVTRRK
jgi:KaiC/GvpD/RAD55 family RecA-like ATPase